jgi:hypothetical protein
LGSALAVERVDFVTIPTRDPNRARAFYHMAFFQDPDGNWVILHRRYAPYG